MVEPHDALFWQAIVDADFAVPAGHSVAELTPELVANLGSPDPQLRDDQAYMILATWIGRDGRYTPQELRALAAEMQANLSHGIGECDTDTVFRRTFSALILGEIVDADTASPFLTSAEVQQWLESALNYAHAERDVRGYVPGKGWAHAVAHTADLLLALARNPHVTAPELERILDAIGDRITTPVDYVYVHLEDERLARAVMVAVQRGLLAPEFLCGWVRRLAERWSGRAWRGARTYEETSAHHNTRQFLHSLYFQLLLGPRLASWYNDPPPHLRELLLNQVIAGLHIMDPGFYAAE